MSPANPLSSLLSLSCIFDTASYMIHLVTRELRGDTSFGKKSRWPVEHACVLAAACLLMTLFSFCFVPFSFCLLWRSNTCLIIMMI